MKTIINILLLALLANLHVTTARDYIIVMKDGLPANEMDIIMDIMCEMSPGECTDIGDFRRTNSLMNTIIGPMSDNAVAMARYMDSVSYVEEDQIATAADAVIDLIPPTAYRNIPRELLLIEDPRENKFSAATSTSPCSTDRYNLDLIDESCGSCIDGEYNPESTGEGTDLYIFDTGIEYSHIDFGGRARYGGFDAVDVAQHQNQQGRDCHGHGTHCAGIAAGRFSGVAKRANIYSIRVLDCNSFGVFSGIVQALDHVYQRHMSKLSLSTDDYRGSVVSMSLAGPVVQATNDAVCRLVRAGVVVVTASGNFRRDACNYSPGSAGCHINVAAHHYTERDTDTCILDAYWFSSSLTSPGNNYGRCVDILAPGQYVDSASYRSRDRYVSMSGTSMACPHVAGAAALLLQENSRMSPARVKGLLIADSCPQINERRIPPQLWGLTPNRRLRVIQNRGKQITTTTTTTTTTTPTTTTTSAAVTTTPSPPKCGLCAFDVGRGSMAEEIEVVVRSIEDPSFIRFGLYFELYNNLRYKQRILTKVSITTIEGAGVCYTLIYKRIPNSQSSNFIYILNNKHGIPYQDIDEEIKELNVRGDQECFPMTIIPIGDNRVYVLADCSSKCNDNEFRQANFTRVPEQILNPFTIDNLESGTKATFDISIAPNQNQVYVSNTIKNNLACECFNYYNIEKSELRTFSETIGRGRKLVVQDIEAVYYRSKLSFTATLCLPDCYTGTNCASEVLNNPVFTDLTEEEMQSTIRSLKRLDWEPIAAVGYQDEGLKHAISFIRVR